MLTVITYGTYDLLHIGHINLLQRARAFGDKLIVALSTYFLKKFCKVIYLPRTKGISTTQRKDEIARVMASA